MALVPPHLSLRRSRWAVVVVFFANGALGATWASRIPTIRDRTHIDNAELGVALFAAAVGAVVTMNISGLIMARYGSRPLIIITGCSLCGALVLLALTSNWPTLTGCLLLFGISNGGMEVAMNAQAVEIERHWKRPILSSFHAAYSLGGLGGAAASSIVVARHIAPLPHFIGASAVLGTLVILAIPFLLHNVDRSLEPPRFTPPSRATIILGAIVFCAVLGEGAMTDWSALYLTSIGASMAVAAIGYAVFSLAMAITRLCGDWITERIGRLVVIRVGTAIAAAGLAFALLIPNPVTVIIGLGGVGVGLATVFPTAMSLAGKSSGMTPGVAIAAIATCGYLGLLVGPVLIGGVASFLTIQIALGSVVILNGVSSLLTSHVLNNGRKAVRQ